MGSTFLTDAWRAVEARSEPELTGMAGWVVDVVGALGTLGVALLVALENIFPPLPSEVILLVAGFVASRGELSIPAVIIAATCGSLVGALALYYLGAGLGRDRVRGWIARLPLVEIKDLDRAERWFDRYGGRAVLICRCVPVVRSLISLPAGVKRMSPYTFVPYTLLGSGLWNTIFVVAGYQLGRRWQSIGRYSDILNGVVLALIGIALSYFVIVRLRRRWKSDR